MRLVYVGPGASNAAGGQRVVRRVRRSEARRSRPAYDDVDDLEDPSFVDDEAAALRSRRAARTARTDDSVAVAPRRGLRGRLGRRSDRGDSGDDDDDDDKDDDKDGSDDDGDGSKRKKLLAGAAGTALAAGAGLLGAKLLSGQKDDSDSDSDKSDDSKDSKKKRKKGGLLSRFGGGRGRSSRGDRSDDGSDDDDDDAGTRRRNDGHGGGGVLSRLWGPKPPPEEPYRGIHDAGDLDPDMISKEEADRVLAYARKPFGYLAVPNTHCFVTEIDGKFSRVLHPGRNRLHMGEEVRYVHSLLVKTIRVDEGFTTGDNLEVGVQARFLMRIQNPMLASYAADDPQKSIIYIALDILRKLIARMPVNLCFSDSDLVSVPATNALNFQLRSWGWRCLRIMLDIAPSNEIREQILMRAMKDREGLSMLADRKLAANINAIDFDHRLHQRERMMYTDELEYIHRCQAEAEARVANASAEIRKMRELAEFLAENPHAARAYDIRNDQVDREFMRERALHNDQLRMQAQVNQHVHPMGPMAADMMRGEAAAAAEARSMSMATGMGSVPSPFRHPGAMYGQDRAAAAMAAVAADEEMSARTGMGYPVNPMDMGVGGAPAPMPMGGMGDAMEEISMRQSMRSGSMGPSAYGPPMGPGPAPGPY